MKLYKNQVGALNPIVIVLIVAVVGVAGFAGWRVIDSNKSDSTKSGGSSSSVADKITDAVTTAEAKAECLKAFDDKDFCKFASNYEQVKISKSVFTNKNADGSTSVMNIEANGDDTSSVVKEGDKEVGAYITLKGVTYFKNVEDNSWYKLPATDTQTDGSPADNPTSDLNFEEEVTNTSDTVSYKKIGKEKCGEIECLKYQVIDTADTETVESFIWFGTKDYRLAKLAGKSKDGSSYEAIFTYPDKVEIKEPSPVKDMPGTEDLQNLLNQQQ